MADRVIVMYAGQVVETGTAEQVFSAPIHPYTQGLLECIPIPGKTARGAMLGSIPGIVPSMIGPMSGCSFRNRCAYAFDACGEASIELRELASGRACRCLLDQAQSLENHRQRAAGAGA
jgi:peptide/nickel transport system ATP-binding protein